MGKRGACQLGAFKRVGINWVADSTCKDSRTTIVSQSTVTGDFQSHYRIDTVILYSPPLANNRREDSEYTEARWLGPCPDNQKPADLTIPGMGVLNMLDGGLRPESAGSAEPSRRGVVPTRRGRLAIYDAGTKSHGLWRASGYSRDRSS